MMYDEWDPWRRYEKERERRMWDPLARYEYEQHRMMGDPLFRFERERERMSWDPYYRMEKQVTDPMHRFEREQERIREDPWFREMYRQEHGLRPDQSADPIYVQEKELGLGTRPQDYLNSEYRVYMDVERRKEEERRIKESADFMQKFFDPNWLSKEEIVKQLRELEERRKESDMAVSRKSGLLNFLKRLFGFF